MKFRVAINRVGKIITFPIENGTDKHIASLLVNAPGKLAWLEKKIQKKWVKIDDIKEIKEVLDVFYLFSDVWDVSDILNNSIEGGIEEMDEIPKDLIKQGQKVVENLSNNYGNFDGISLDLIQDYWKKAAA
jgi:hypothetical protein